MILSRRRGSLTVDANRLGHRADTSPDCPMIFSPPEAIEIAERFTQAFPELQASWYIMGSHASGDAIDLSDVDLAAYKESIAAGFGQAIEHFHRDRRVEVPPEASDEFLGYVDRAPSWARLERWTHGIVVLIGKAAGAVSACEGRTAGSREEALAQ